RPGLCERVDPALVAGLRAAGRSVVVVGAPVPRAVSAGVVEGGHEPGTMGGIPGDPGAIAAPFAERKEPVDDVDEEEAEPHALAAPLPTHSIHPVVPVTRSHEGQTMRPARERAVQGTTAVLVDVGGLVGDLRREIGFVLPRLERAC